MSTQYSGLPSVARGFWSGYFRIVIGFSLLLIFTGSIAAVITLEFLPEAVWYLVFAGVGFIFHLSALFLRDILLGDYEPSQTQFSSATALLATILLLGFWFSAILLIAVSGGYLLSTYLELPLYLSIGFAVYYPVVDTVLIRHGIPTPGLIVITSTVILMNTAIDIHHSLIDTLPVIGKRERRHS